MKYFQIMDSVVLKNIIIVILVVYILIIYQQYSHGQVFLIVQWNLTWLKKNMLQGLMVLKLDIPF